MTHEQVQKFQQWLRDHHYAYGKGFWAAPTGNKTLVFVTGRDYVLKLTHHDKELQTVSNLEVEDLERMYKKS